MSDASNPTERKHSGLIPYKPGQSGNPAGRPKGSRNKLTEAFIEAMHASFVAHGPDTIEIVRTEKPDQYLKVIASLVPKDVNLTVNNLDDLSDAELAERIQSLATQLAPFLAGGTGNANEGAEGAGSAGEPSRVH